MPASLGRQVGGIGLVRGEVENFEDLRQRY
jgi:hypothetical protein